MIDVGRASVREPIATGAEPARRHSLGALFLIAHAPMAVFGVVVSLVTLALLPLLDDEAMRLIQRVTSVDTCSAAIHELGARFSTVWMYCLAGFYAAIGVGSTTVAWTQRVLSRRIARIAAQTERLGAGERQVLVEVEADDALGKVERSLRRVAESLEVRDRAQVADAAEREQLSRLQRAMALIDTEQDAMRVVGRALYMLARDIPAELLVAPAPDAPLKRVVASSTVAPPGCSVDFAQRCPAVHRGGTSLFPDSDALDACPKLQGRGHALSALCIPVMVMGRSAGVLHVARERDRGFAPRTVAALEALSGAFGMRAGMLRAIGSAQLAAETDPLTGLLNRRGLEVKAAQLLAGSGRVVVGMADLDHFKQLNDEHGHGMGDRALALFAQVLKRTLRPGDVVARYGGEEFAVMLADCSSEDAVRALDRVRAALQRRCIDEGVIKFTVSMGVSEFPRQGESLDELLRVADIALYQAKEQGRDRVTVAS